LVGFLIFGQIIYQNEMVQFFRLDYHTTDKIMATVRFDCLSYFLQF